ncbi:MAG: zincin-like metallopeptidase domain-containing protein, partial [Pseudorhodoplanes sp.]
HVRKGEQGSLVVYASSVTRKETNEDSSEESERDIPFFKSYTVFNVEQIEGLPEHYYGRAEPVTDALPRIAQAETIFAATGADIRHGGGRAYYSISSDHVQMPPFESFRDAESYYAVLAHEMTHYAVRWIMPHGQALRRANRFWAMRQFGIIRAIRKPRSSVVSCLSASRLKRTGAVLAAIELPLSGGSEAEGNFVRNVAVHGVRSGAANVVGPYRRTDIRFGFLDTAPSRMI